MIQMFSGVNSDYNSKTMMKTLLQKKKNKGKKCL